MEVKQDNIKIAQFLAHAIGFEPHVYPYYDDNKENQLDILSLVDPIDEKVGIFSTIGLSDYPNHIELNDGQKKNVPVELIMTGYKDHDKVANILSTCGFYIMKDKYQCLPGSVFMRMISFYYPDSPMKHIYFTEPYLWQDKLEQFHLDSKQIAFLLCIPISEAELQFKLKSGEEALEQLLQDNEIDIYDLNRESVV